MLHATLTAEDSDDAEDAGRDHHLPEGVTWAPRATCAEDAG